MADALRGLTDRVASAITRKPRQKRWVPDTLKERQKRAIANQDPEEKAELIERTSKAYERAKDNVKQWKEQHRKDKKEDPDASDAGVRMWQAWEKRRLREYKDALEGIDSTDFLENQRNHWTRVHGRLKRRPYRWEAPRPEYRSGALAMTEEEAYAYRLMEAGWDPDLPKETYDEYQREESLRIDAQLRRNRERDLRRSERLRNYRINKRLEER